MRKEIKTPELTDDILVLNRDLEHLVIYAGAKRCAGLEFDDKYDILQFVLFSDTHLDRFNVIRIGANIGLFKIVRVGDNMDFCMRSRTALCFDYINKKVITSV